MGGKILINGLKETSLIAAYTYIYLFTNFNEDHQSKSLSPLISMLRTVPLWVDCKPPYPSYAEHNL